MSGYIEPTEELGDTVLDNVRALNSLKEEIEAVIWYQQRAAACSDEKLRAVVEHNMVEEIEHASMALEWLRRNMQGWEENLRTYLFTTQDITSLESEEEEEGGNGKPGSGLGLGSLK